MIPYKKRLLPHFNKRPQDSEIDTIVIHSMYALSKPDPFDPDACIKALDENKVASHYLIERGGDIWCLVKDSDRAWHAGESKMPFDFDNREAVNDFSIGIEVIATEESGFTEEEYRALALLSKELLDHFQIRSIVGHEHIAPGRKQDPGPLFNWEKFRRSLKNLGIDCSNVHFAD